MFEVSSWELVMPYYEKAGGEVSPRRFPKTELPPDCLFYFLLHSQFSLPQVHSDFVNGRFGSWAKHVMCPYQNCISSVHCCSLLGLVLMAFRCIWIWSFVPHRLVEKQFGTLLLSEDLDIPMRTYKQWHKILHELAFCSYWKNVALHCYQLGGSVPSCTVHTNTEPVQTLDVGSLCPCFYHWCGYLHWVCGWAPSVV